jgi:hypothetical protein
VASGRADAEAWSADLVDELARQLDPSATGTLRYTGAEAINEMLSRLNRIARLAAACAPDDEAGREAPGDWTAEVEVPVTALPGPGRLVLIDTPGLHVDTAASRTGTVLDEAHGCIVVVDYAQVGSVDSDLLTRFVAEHAGGFAAGHAVLTAVTVNRVDQRDANASEDRGPEHTARIGRRASGLPAGADPLIFETSARRGLAAQRVADGDTGAIADLLREVYRVHPPDPAELTALQIAELAEEAMSTAGTAALRAALFGRVGADLPRLAAEHALRRVAALDVADPSAAGALASLTDAVRWAMSRSAPGGSP